MVTALLIVARVKPRRGKPSQVEQYVREHAVRPARFAPPRRLDRKVAFSVDTRHGWTCYRVVPRNAPKLRVVNNSYRNGGLNRNAIAPSERWNPLCCNGNRSRRRFAKGSRRGLGAELSRRGRLSRRDRPGKPVA
jgi:hypothetical protein